MRTSDRGIAFIVAHEGVVPAPYLDSVNVWTYGIGHTAAAGSPNPKAMARGMPVDLDAGLRQVFDVFRRDLVQYENAVTTAIAGANVAQHEFDAAVSFHFNTGAIGRAEWVKLWRAGRKSEAAASMLANWRKPSEIIPRRTAERDLFLSGSYGSKTAAVWPVSASGRVTWKPVRSLSQSQILALMGKPPVTDATTAPGQGVFAALVALLQSIFGGKK